MSERYYCEDRGSDGGQASLRTPLLRGAGHSLQRSSYTRSDEPLEYETAEASQAITRGGTTGPGTARTILDFAYGLRVLKSVLRRDFGVMEKEILYRVGFEGARMYFSAQNLGPPDTDPRKELAKLIETCAAGGLSRFTVADLDKASRFIELRARGTLEELGFDDAKEHRSEPACSYTCGFVAWMCQHVFDGHAGDGTDEIVATEVECVTQGKGECRYLAGPRAQLRERGFGPVERKESKQEHTLRLNEEILLKNLDLQNTNLSLERQLRKKSEELRRAEDSHRALVDLCPDPIITVTLDGKVEAINAAGMEVLGHEPRANGSDPCISNIFADLDTVSQLIWSAEKEGVVRSQEFGLVRKDGSTITGEVSARLMDIPAGRTIQLVIKDVSEKRDLQMTVDETKEEAQLLNDLLSHDIVNYVTAAMHFLENLRRSPHLTEDDRKNLSIVAKDIKGAYELAAVVRDASRTRALGEKDCEARDLGSVLSETIEEARKMYWDRRIRISFDRPAEPRYALGNALLPRVFANLISNSVKFDPSEEVVIDACIEPHVDGGAECWQVRIADHGKGIPDGDKKRVFDRFYRGDTSMPGTGLGLYMVSQLVGVCKGKVWAEDRVQGDHTKGAVMVVQLQRVVNGQRRDHGRSAK